jgi:hypothetical protein
MTFYAEQKMPEGNLGANSVKTKVCAYCDRQLANNAVDRSLASLEAIGRQLNDFNSIETLNPFEWARDSGPLCHECSTSWRVITRDV